MGKNNLFHFSPLVNQLADLIQESISNSEYSRLPSIRNLARQYQVSYVTMTKVLKLLQQRGVVDVSPGRRAVIDNNRIPELQPQPNTSELLYNELREKILHGDILSGSQLPKLDFWKIIHSMSIRSVRNTYQSLVANKLALKCLPMLVQRNGCGTLRSALFKQTRPHRHPFYGRL